MALVDTIRNAVATADGVTKSLQPSITMKPWIRSDGAGAPQYGTPVTVRAISERRTSMRYTSTGQEIVSNHYLAILDPIAPNGAAGRREPIDERDVFVLPDGTTGPIVDIRGLTDAGSAEGASFLYEVWLGTTRGGR
jgi:hypothetical protein